MKRAKFVLRKTPSGYYFNLVAPNGEIISTSETYESRQGAQNGIRAVVANAGTATIEEPAD